MKLNKIYELNVQHPISRLWTTVRPPITIEFDIDRHPWSSSSSANIKIYNLSEETRSGIFQDWWTQPQGGANLKAGYRYESGGISTIFDGIMIYAHSTRRGSEIITQLECQDLQLVTLQHESSVSLSLDSGRTKSEILKQLFKDLGYSNWIIDPVYESSPYTGNRGLSLIGNTLQICSDIVGSSGMFFVDRGLPIAISYGSAIYNSGFSTISKETGLLNLPVAAKNIVMAQLLFTPQIQVGQYIKMNGYQDKHYDGDYVVIGVRHSGIISETHDSHTTTTVTLSRNVVYDKLFNVVQQ